MKITFDPAKDVLNQQKHEVPLIEARYFEWHTAVIWSDNRRDYGENRLVALGYIGQRLHVLVFVERDKQARIISLCKANRREVKRYAET